MSLSGLLESIGEYAMLMKQVLTPPDRAREFFKEFLKELYKLGVTSIWLVVLISFFIGAVIVVQLALNLNYPFLPSYTVGVVSREIILLEFSSTIMCLILSGKVGSNIASEIGTMRITEQIDALEVMGVNSANYLILPKIMAFIVFIPVLVVFSIFVGLMGGYLMCALTGNPPVVTYIYGLRAFFRVFCLLYCPVPVIYLHLFYQTKKVVLNHQTENPKHVPPNV
jgi:phospholipid/cholesterol/gamma-HCH transport system permease protein